MYYTHFGLSGPPFQLTSSPNSLYMSKEHREAFAALEWGLLHEPSGFTVLVGEVGTGKTTLALTILARQYQNLRTAYLSNPKLSFEEILKLIMKQFGVKSQPKRQLPEFEVFKGFLGQLESGQRVVIIVDEAQGLSDEALEQLRLLSNSEKADEKQLHFVFVGQPELLHRLATPALRQLNQRIGARSILNPLKRAESYEYIAQRLRASGGNAKRIFKPGALRYVVRHSGGIPRRINVLCHNAMLLAYSASAHQVDTRMVRVAVTEYDNLFLRLKPTREPGGSEAWLRRWSRRFIESLALRLLGLSRTIYPEEFRAIDAESATPAMPRPDDTALQESEMSPVGESASASIAQSALAPK